MASEVGKDQGKSAFVGDVLTKDHQANTEAVNRAWTKAGHAGTISESLVNQIRSRMGLTGQQRQADDAEPSVPGKLGQHDPALAEKEFRPGRSGCRIVMDARPLDVRPVPLRRRVVQREDQPVSGLDSFGDDPQEHGGDPLCLAAEGVEEVVVLSFFRSPVTSMMRLSRSSGPWPSSIRTRKSGTYCRLTPETVYGIVKPSP